MSQALHIVCPHCLTTNRVGEKRLNDHPNCGQCHQALFTGKPITLNSAAFKRQLGSSHIPLIVDFWASWCGPCKMMAPAFEAAAKRVEPKARLAKVNTEEEQALAAQYGIRSIPTLILFKNGQEVARQPGAMGEADIVTWIQQAL